MKLPSPDSDEFNDLVRNRVDRIIYRILYDARPTPIPINEIRRRAELPEDDDQEHFGRRLRNLYSLFEIERARDGKQTTYLLVSRLAEPKRPAGRISKKLRAQVLRDQRCAQCGRMPTEDKVKLHVDHKIPQEWGGSNEEDNLQALCSECNEGKRNYYATFDDAGSEILKAATFDEPHVRIGEAFKAAYPEQLPTDLLERIASSKQFQADWQKRARELRYIGWDVVWERRKIDGRVHVTYGIGAPAPPWPDGDVGALIRRIEKERKEAKKRKRESS